jgi:manganese/iron transport system substrate-binding protein
MFFWIGVVGVISTAAAQEAAKTGEPLPRVLVCSTTQIADFARQIVGDDWEVKCILAPGQDPHLYEATPNDARLVRSADLCLQNGLHLEGHDWMRVLAEGESKRIVTCTANIPPLMLRQDGDQAAVPDPHAWFTPRNAVVYVRNITQALTELDPDHGDAYRARAELYLKQLSAVHRWILQQVNRIPVGRRVLVTSHDAFNYFCQEYGFQPRSPVGWSTGQEVGGGITPRRRLEVVDSIRASGVPAIFVETSVNPKLIREIARESGVQLGGELYSDSMGAAGTAGESYIGMMRENVLQIVSALSDSR